MKGSGDGGIPVEVAYVGPEGQFLIAFDVPPGTTLDDAIERSGLLQRVPGLVPDPRRIGVFGKLKPPQTPVAAGDRIEVYRPLLADPRESRRQRAARER